MATRGKKLRSAENSPPTLPGIVRHETLDAPCNLSKAAQIEYDRLCAVLQSKGTLDRVDLGAIAEAARIKDWLDRAYAAIKGLPTLADVKCIGQLTNQRRGLLRELGLTLQPSRSVVKTNPVPAEEDPLAKLVKLSG